jgi:hypothetical protein
VAWLDTPPAAGRAWVPGCRARTFHQSVAPFYDESRSQGSPGRDQFVISISGPVYIPLTGASSRHAGPAISAAPAKEKIFALAEHYDGTSVHDQAIYVVIRLHGFLVAIRWLCGAAKADKLPIERSRPTPPGPDRARPPLSPPAGAASSPCSVACSHLRMRPQYLPGGRPPGTPQSVGDAPPHPLLPRGSSRHGLASAWLLSGHGSPAAAWFSGLGPPASRVTSRGAPSVPCPGIFVVLVRFGQKNVQ